MTVGDLFNTIGVLPPDGLARDRRWSIYAVVTCIGSGGVP